MSEVKIFSIYYSKQNLFYGELTCWYWVWKNWLPQHSLKKRCYEIKELLKQGKEYNEYKKNGIDYYSLFE